MSKWNPTGQQHLTVRSVLLHTCIFITLRCELALCPGAQHQISAALIWWQDCFPWGLWRTGPDLQTFRPSKMPSDKIRPAQDHLPLVLASLCGSAISPALTSSTLAGDSSLGWAPASEPEHLLASCRSGSTCIPLHSSFITYGCWPVKELCT
jgi:hypothetical protein